MGANAAIRERLGDPLGDARRTLTEAAYTEAWEAGLAMSVDDAVREALAVRA